MKLQDKTAVVTGGGTGIGLGIAAAMAAEGCRVAITGRREDKLREAVDSCGGQTRVLFRVADVASRDSVEKLFRWADAELGQVDILVNSAGVNIRTRTMAELTPEQWDRVIGINLTGAYNCIHAVLPQMRARKDGLIFNISSLSGKRAIEIGGVAYNASKFGMTALGTTVGLEEAPNGIRVTNIFPGEVVTPLLDKRPNPISAERRAGMVRPEDLAAMVVAVACLPQRVHIPELLIKPLQQEYA